MPAPCFPAISTSSTLIQLPSRRLHREPGVISATTPCADLAATTGICPSSRPSRSVKPVAAASSFAWRPSTLGTIHSSKTLIPARMMAVSASSFPPTPGEFSSSVGKSTSDTNPGGGASSTPLALTPASGGLFLLARRIRSSTETDRLSFLEHSNHLRQFIHAAGHHVQEFSYRRTPTRGRL